MNLSVFLKENPMRVVSLTMLMLIAQVGSSQTFTCTIQNQSVAGTDFLYDIYMQRTGVSDIYLGNSDFVLTFESANFTNPILTIDQPGEPGSKIETFYTIGGAIVSSNRAVVNVGRPGVSSQSQFNARIEVISTSSPGTLIAQVRISGISNPSGFANLQWRLDVPNNTVVSTSANTTPWAQTEITGQGTFLNPANQPLPIQLASFTASASGQNRVQLDWSTVSELNNYGFEVQKSAGGTGSYATIPGSFVPGHGTTLVPQYYSYTDTTAQPGLWYYRLKQIDLDGTLHYTEGVSVHVVTSVEEQVPKVFALHQNYPNPFNPTTEIRFSVERNARTTLELYNILGERVALLFDALAEAGKYYAVTLAANDLPSGVYLYRLQSGEKSAVRRMLLVK